MQNYKNVTINTATCGLTLFPLRLYPAPWARPSYMFSFQSIYYSLFWTSIFWSPAINIYSPIFRNQQNFQRLRHCMTRISDFLICSSCFSTHFSFHNDHQNPRVTLVSFHKIPRCGFLDRYQFLPCFARITILLFGFQSMSRFVRPTTSRMDIVKFNARKK